MVLQELEGALSAARAEVSLLVSQRTAAATKSSSEIETLQASTHRGASMLLIFVHVLYLVAGLIVYLADGLKGLAVRLG